MSVERMSLKILLPYKVFTQVHQVERIVAMTHQGSLGILPHRLDCVASLSAGILVFEVENKEEVYIAVNEGVLVKTGLNVLVSVRNAMSGLGLEELRTAVENEFLQLNEQEQMLRSVLMKMETGLIHRMASFKHDAF
jgi:F-type H+-transporting ATPase subunit epsilon